METLMAAFIVAVLSLVHLFAGRLRFLGGVPRSRWLSFGSGVSIAYVFVHVLPELAMRQQEVEESERFGITSLEHHLYLMAMAGLALFYGLERVVRGSHRRTGDPAELDPETSPGIFWLHMGSFALYNVLIGYLLLHREEEGETSLILFGAAMAVHFVVNDFGLREDHHAVYDRIGRWALAAAAIVGWALGTVIEVGAEMVGGLFAFLAGGVVLNVLKEELPEERQSRFGAFALGIALYTAILLVSE